MARPYLLLFFCFVMAPEAWAFQTLQGILITDEDHTRYELEVYKGDQKEATWPLKAAEYMVNIELGTRAMSPRTRVNQYWQHQLPTILQGQFEGGVFDVLRFVAGPATGDEAMVSEKQQAEMKEIEAKLDGLAAEKKPDVRQTALRRLMRALDRIREKAVTAGAIHKARELKARLNKELLDGQAGIDPGH